MKRAAIYIRVSTTEQQLNGLSLDSQLDALKAYCEEHGYSIVDVYSDAGISAHIKYTRRPELIRMIKDCQDNKIDIILVTKLDRFFRSVKDYYAVMEQVGKVPWRAIWEDYETETSAGIFKVNIMLSVAQAESDRTSERVKAVRAYQREKGEFVGGRAPLGYKIENNNLVIDSETHDAVKAFFDTYLATGKQIEAIKAADRCGVSITMQKARKMAQNETYTGKVGKYRCDAYITVDQYDRLNNVIRAKFVKTDGKANRVYIFSGLIKCGECGRCWGAHYHLNKGPHRNTIHYKSYRCQYAIEYHNCSNKGILMESTIEKYLINNLDEQLNAYNAQASISQSQAKKVSANIASLKRKMQRIGDRYENDEISREEYISKITQIKEELDQQQKVIRPKQTAQLPENWKAIYEQLTDEHKQQFWRNIIDSIIIKPGKIIELVFI